MMITSEKKRWVMVMSVMLLWSGVQIVSAQEVYGYTAQWGSRGSGAGQFHDPVGLAVDSTGNIYVVNRLNDRIQKFTSSGTFIKEWGATYGTGDGQFNDPRGVAVDRAGNVYVADSGNNRVQKFDSSGAFITKWGSNNTRSGVEKGNFSTPLGIAVDRDGNVYVVDAFNSRIQKFDSSGAFITQWGGRGPGVGQLWCPGAITVDSAGNVYVLDGNPNSTIDGHMNRVQKFTSSGTFVTRWGVVGSGVGLFGFPSGIAADSAGNVFVSNTYGGQIQKFDPAGTLITQWDSHASGAGQFNSATGIAVDSAGIVYVIDGTRVLKFALMNPTVTFTANVTNGTSHLPVSFTDTSTGAITARFWSFGDGSTSTEQNPVHVYTMPGIYSVTLTTTNAYGSSTLNRPEYITVTAPPPIGFSANVTTGLSPLAVQFNGSTTGSVQYFFWQFGDGSTSTEQNPIHSYDAVGSYTVSLVVIGSHGSQGKTIERYVTVTSPFIPTPSTTAPTPTPPVTTTAPTPTPPVTTTAPTPSLLAGFYAYGHVGQAPYSVRFLDQSTGSPTAWHWDFGDGSTSIEQNPTHVFTCTGTYNVVLTASNDQASNTAIQYRCIIVNTVPVAAFTANVTSGPTSFAVQFTDQSSGASGYEWQFGDGATSTDQNPVHTYSQPGTYTVTLVIAAADYGSVFVQRPGYITVADPPTVGFSANVTAGHSPLAVQFNESTTGSVQYFYWKFGDGGTSFDQNPIHVYNAAGRYPVSLYAISSSGTLVKTVENYIDVTAR